MIRNPEKLVGTKCNMLKINSLKRGYKQMLRLAVCSCDCGREYTTRLDHVLNGSAKSCGCVKRPIVSKAGYPNLKWLHSRTPDGRSTPEYNSWSSMIGRCTRSTHPEWENYGGRGIKVFERWMNFDNFFADMGHRPKGTSLDRIETNGSYSPINCRWACKTIQANNKRSCVFVEYMGEKYTIKQLSVASGVPYKVLHSRIQRLKWSVDNAIALPVKRSIQF